MSRLTDQPVKKYVALSQVSIYVAGARQNLLNKFEHLETSMKKVLWILREPSEN